MRCLSRSLGINAVAVTMFVAGSIGGADWPQWRGPDRNGLHERSAALIHSFAGLSPLWQSERIAGGDHGGRGSLVAYAGKVFGLTRAPSEGTAADEVFCLDAANGKTVWKSRLADTKGANGGSSTPCVVNGKLYIIGSGSKVFCLSADKGKTIWEIALARPANRPVASSISVIGKSVVLLADVLTALDAETGAVLWTQERITGAESSPSQWRTKGCDMVICNTARETHGVDATDGKILWSIPGGGRSTPVVAQEYGGDFLVNMSDNRKNGLTAYRLTDMGPQKLWTLPVSDRAASPVVFDGYVYAIAGGGSGHGAHILCVHLDSGKVAWDEEIDFAEVSSPVVADGKMLAVCGTFLWLLQATPEKYGLLSQADYRITLCTSPALADGRLYFRQANAVVCIDLRVAP